jgi:hypothetical protein
MTGANNPKDDGVVYSEKIITEDFEKYTEDEKEDHYDDLDEPWISESKGSDELEIQPKKKLHLSDEAELDMAIVNDISVTEDDPSLRSVTFRSILIAVVCTFTILIYINQ